MTIYVAWGALLLVTMAVAAMALAGDADMARLKTIERCATWLLIFTIAFGVGTIFK